LLAQAGLQTPELQELSSTNNHATRESTKCKLAMIQCCGKAWTEHLLAKINTGKH